MVEIKNLDEYCIRYHSPESLESLDHLVLIMWSNDTTLIPPQSAHFGFFDVSMKIQPLR